LQRREFSGSVNVTGVTADLATDFSGNWVTRTFTFTTLSTTAYLALIFTQGQGYGVSAGVSGQVIEVDEISVRPTADV
jgi:hypothetical protein